jgi:hypothetical protein
VDKKRILYFLEDRAQEGFVKALVERIALVGEHLRFCKRNTMD